MALPLSAHAVMDPTNVKVNISGTVVANGSCSFSGGNPITVEFGDVYISDIAEGKYRQKINYTVSCKGDAGGKAIQLQLSGDGADFDGKLLKTNAKGLGIKLLWNQGQIAPATWYDLNPSTPPILEGVLVRAKGAEFANGQEFSAAATLKVAYN
ncbi:fimbrial protein [Cedecea neteri]|uniref:fimbrial protein n=1 Tax=Cedecea neteri TaxID=158822 RepID=UPI002AA79611|nr:fimbrial protein [Cedecea neteri]WPU21982.1 fimbrial protein [Cedecea neteri]